jgi:hypothetical protein
MAALRLFFLIHLSLFVFQQAEGQTDTFTHHVVCVNQSGYNTNGPKRFTAPLSSGDARFVITHSTGHTVLFSGVVNNGIGDFSPFSPAADTGEFVIKVYGAGRDTGVSYPFAIHPFHLETTFYPPALDFMIDDRSVTGTHPSAYGGCPWRDGTYYSFEVPSLILLWQANASFFKQLPVQISYRKDKERVLSPAFKYIMDAEGQDALAVARRYYTTIDPPVGRTVPDIVQLIHWGIGFYLLHPVTRDPSDNAANRKLHAQTVEQFAFFLSAYPTLQQYFTPAFYRQAHDFAFSHWDSAGLFRVNRVVGDGKGRECPGHSIFPNLLMYEVAKREGRSDSSLFFQAACRQTRWIIDSLDWNDARTTKGQRMSEHKLLPALVYFLQRYPQQAPPGLQNKIDQWTAVMLRRSNNSWDFRRYDLDSNWSIPSYNEPGNLAGFPACALAAASVTADSSCKAKLEIIAYGAIDALFGRNPLNACSPYHIENGFTRLEKGWPKAFANNTCARLERVRGTLSSSCPTEMYPFRPGTAFRHPEGWTSFNAAWNAGLAYLGWYNTRLSCTQDGAVTLEAPLYKGTPTVQAAAEGRHFTIQLHPDTTGKGRYSGHLPARLLALKSAKIVLHYGEGPFTKEWVL